MKQPHVPRPIRPTHWPRDTEHLLVLLATENLTTQIIAAWATRALLDGYESPSLGVLAGCDSGPDEGHWGIKDDLGKALRELHIDVTSPGALGRLYIDWEARRIVTRETDPIEAVEAIHRRVVTPLGHPDDLSGWCLLWEGNDPLELAPLDHRELYSTIIQYANAWLRSVDMT